MSTAPWFWALAILVLVVTTRVRVVPDHERYALIVLGRFASFKGPGPVFRGKGAAAWKKVQTGERGVLINPTTVRVAAGDIPALVDGNPKVGAFVRVTGFEQKRILAAVDSDQSRVFRCDKCGHENRV